MVPRRLSLAASCATSVAASACCAAASDSAAPRPTAPAMPRRFLGAPSLFISAMRLSWLLRGCSMLNATQPSAGRNSRPMVLRRPSPAASVASSVAACALPAANSVDAAAGSARSLATCDGDE